MQDVSDIFGRAKDAYQRGRLRESRHACWAALDIEPKHAASWNLLGRCLLERGRTRASIKPACRAIANEPENETYRKDFEDAIAKLGRVPWSRFGHGRSMLEKLKAAPDWGQGIPDSGRPQPIHFGCSFDSMGGTERQALQTYEDLRPYADVRLWAQDEPDPRIVERYEIGRIDRHNYPRGGTLVVCGVWWPGGKWIQESEPERVVLHLNTLNPIGLLEWLSILRAWRARPIEIAYPSHGLKRIFGLPGRVERSAIDLDTFAPCAAVRPAGDDGRFTIGRLSRGNASKHHPGDAYLYKVFAAEGDRVRIMDGRPLASDIGHIDRIDLLPIDGEPAADFLHSLDCLFYRTGEAHEAWGRVVAEAMACALPVVCHRIGGYAEAIVDGENGFLFDSTDQALDILRRLKGDPALRQRVGAAARASMEDMFSAREQEETRRYYVG
jgi:glycosyltransferase involved in cell wall biosynthesis